MGACTFPQPVLCRDGGRTGGTDRHQPHLSLGTFMCFALRSPGDKAGPYVQPVCGALCKATSAVHVLCVMLTRY